MASVQTPRPLDVSEQDVALGLSLDVDERTLKRLVTDLPGVLQSQESDQQRAKAKSQVRLSALDTLFSRLDTVAQNTCPAEVEAYDLELKDLAKEQEQIEAEIEVLTNELEQAQKERGYKLEYDALAKEIVKYAPRIETEEAIERLHQTLVQLGHERRGYRSIAEGIKEQYEDATAIFGKMQTYISEQIATREREAVQTGADREDNEDENEDELGQQQEGTNHASARRADHVTLTHPADDEADDGEAHINRRDSPSAHPGALDSKEEGEEHEEGATSTQAGVRATTPSAYSLNPSAATFRPSIPARFNSPASQDSRTGKRTRNDDAKEPVESSEDLHQKRRR